MKPVSAFYDIVQRIFMHYTFKGAKGTPSDASKVNTE